MDVCLLNSNVVSDSPGTIINNLRINMNINEQVENKIFHFLTEHNAVSLRFLCEGIPNINLEHGGDSDLKIKLKLGFHGFLGRYTDEHKYLLAELLYHIKRYDLLRLLGVCWHQVEKLSKNFKYVQPYWLLLYSVCEVITEEESIAISRNEFQENFIYRMHFEHKISQENVNQLIFILKGLPQDSDITHAIDELSKYQAQFEFYPMDKNPCGICLIFNMENFSQPADKPDLELDSRQGSTVDVKNLYRTFKAFGFNVCVEKNKPYLQTLDKIKYYSKYDHSNYNCFILCFLSHGKQNGASTVLYTSDGEEIIMGDIIHYFNGNNCPTLLGKPKIFIVQACRGTDVMQPVGLLPDFVELEQAEVTEQSDGCLLSDVVSDAPHNQRTDLHASESDILECYATRLGFKSFRHPEDGSWYIKTLCGQLLFSGDQKNFFSILTSVNRFIEKASNNLGGKQMPQFDSSLLKEIRFRRIIT